MKRFFKTHYKTLIIIAITLIIGTINHFVYNWTNQLVILKPFFPIDESVFEHFKLIFYPMIVVSIFESFILKKDFIQLISTRGLASVISCLLISLLFITYTRNNINNHNPIIDISSYYIFTTAAFYLSDHIFNTYASRTKFQVFSMIIIFLSMILLTYFTDNKPSFIIFQKP